MYTYIQALNIKICTSTTRSNKLSLLQAFAHVETIKRIKRLLYLSKWKRRWEALCARREGIKIIHSFIRPAMMITSAQTNARVSAHTFAYAPDTMLTRVDTSKTPFQCRLVQSRCHVSCTDDRNHKRICQSLHR